MKKSPSFQAPMASQSPSPTADASDSQPRAWQRMLSGRRLDLLSPCAQDIEIEDIAHGLARVARWNGQTIGEHAFSVAQHALVVEKIYRVNVPDTTAGNELRLGRLAALLHDAPEYVIGDMISPFKNALGLDYRIFERRLQEAIHERFGLPQSLPSDMQQAIKRADRISAYFEAVALAGFCQHEADQLFGRPVQLPQPLCTELAQLAAWPADFAQQRFLTSFKELSSD